VSSEAKGAVEAPAADDRDPRTWPPEALARLQHILDESLRSAGAAVSETFDHAQRRLTAAEFATAWNAVRLKAMATVGKNGPHIAPVHAELVAGKLRSTIYDNAVRLRDLRRNPEVAFTTWAPNGFTAIVHGRAHEIPGSLRDTRPGATGRPRRTVALEIEITRIYAMGERKA
jgi:hypothetical protein